ncbi:MAG: ribbon-helix-helix protein, CopG family [Candidatus Micrarchaeaceae archaeon]
MEILSISMDKEELKRLEEIQKKLGFRSRSKMLRSALESLSKEYGSIGSLKGNVESVFILAYPDSKKDKVSDVLHKFEDSIKSELHHHHGGTCIDILNLETSAETTKEFFGIVKSSKYIASATYSIVSEKQRQ